MRELENAGGDHSHEGGDKRHRTRRLCSLTLSLFLGLSGAAFMRSYGYYNVEMLGNAVMIILVLMQLVDITLALDAHRFRPQMVQVPDRKDSQAACPDTGASALLQQLSSLNDGDPETDIDEGTCRRFLVACKGDAGLARSRIENYVAWRRRDRPGEITAVQVHREAAKRVSVQHGTDRRGHPVIWGFPYRHDKNNCDLDELMRLIVFTMENCLRMGAEQGLERVIVVFTLQGFGVKCMDYNFVKRFLFIMANYYPERLGQILLWNAPTIFNIFWGIVHPWINPNTAQKVMFVDTESLESFIAPDQFPEDAVVLAQA